MTPDQLWSGLNAMQEKERDAVLDWVIELAQAHSEWVTWAEMNGEPF